MFVVKINKKAVLYTAFFDVILNFFVRFLYINFSDCIV